ncbi:MAG: hypothetical protein WD009_13005 [Phycisphaeraceae bacterium]
MTHTLPRSAGHNLLLLAAALALVAGLAGCETATMMREKGQVALRDGDYDLARHELQRANAAKPGDVRTQYYLGLTHLRLGEPRHAQSALERALTLTRHEEPWRSRVLDLLAEAMHERDQDERLVILLQEAVDETGAARDYVRLGKWQARMGNVDEAGRAFTQATQVAGDDDVQPYLEAAIFYESVGHVDHAVRALRYAHWVDPSHREVAERLRRHGVVPGPAASTQPTRTR